MSSHSYPPALKNTVDLQLQTAFSESNWATVIRLADKRAKSLKDPYYEVIKLCAESQLDGPSEQCAVLFVVDDYVRKGTVVKDLDTIELLEWACRSFRDGLGYRDSLGVLRLRWVKAYPRSPAVTQCLQACLQHWDLVNAQQIAALLDKSAPNSTDRRFRFWSVTLTFLLSISPQCPEGKQKLYGLLSLKQLERAADVTEAADTDDPTDRGLRAEEELYLYYRVLATHGSKDDYMKRIRSPRVGALKQFREGRKHLFLEALDAFEAWGEWDDIYEFCLEALRWTDDDGAPSFLASDWRVWKRFIESASKRSDDEKAFEEVQTLLRTFITTEAKVAQMYKKTIALAVLETTFRMPPTLLPQAPRAGVAMPRVVQLCLFLEDNFDRLSVFDDVKGHVSSLTFEEIDCFLAEMLPKLSGDETKSIKAIALKVLELKFRYLLTTCPQTLSRLPSVAGEASQGAPYRCRICLSTTSMPCAACLDNIVTSASSVHQAICADPSIVKEIPSLDKDPRSDLSLIIAMSVLKSAGLDGQHSSNSGAPLLSVDPTRFLQAVLVLDKQLKETPDDTTLRLLLIQMYLVLGCASYANQLWAPMNVTRTIQDALSPLFYDRIFSLSPGLFQGSRPLTEPLRYYYSSTLRDGHPVRIWDAFSSGSYSSILGVAEFDNRLRRSCTLMMSVVEERRATRAFGGRLIDNVDELALTADIDDATEFVNVTDYGSFPSLESSHSPPPQDLVRLGPGLSNERSHLSFLTEQYLDIVTWKVPKEYKPSKVNDVAVKDKSYLIESLARIHNSFTNFLHLQETPAKLTGPEEAYFTVLSLLSAIVLTALTAAPDAPPPGTLSALTSSVKASIVSLRTAFVSAPPNRLSQPETFYSLADMHTTSTLRDVALAVKYSTSFALAFHDKEMARDKTGKSNLHKDVLAEIKALDALAPKILGDIKGRIKMLKGKLGEAGWLDQLLDWTFESGSSEDNVTRAISDVVGGRSGAEDWAGKVLESWREGVKGWNYVKME